MSDHQKPANPPPSRRSIRQHSASPAIARRRSGRSGGAATPRARIRNARTPSSPFAIRSIVSVPLRYLSASMVVILSLFMAIAYSLTQWRDVVTITIVIAIVVLANGWSGLVHTPDRYPAAITTMIVGIPTVVIVRLTNDMAWGTIALGLTVLVAAVVEMGRPQPREDLVKSLSASVAAGLIAVLGSAWVSLTTSPLWSIILIGAAVVTSLTVIGDQFGTSLWSNTIGSLVVGTVSGILLGSVAIFMGRDAHIVALAFPALPGAGNSLISIMITSGVLGLAIGAVIAIVDGLVGEHNRRCTEAGAFARGAMKFLLAVTPIYLLVHVGAL